MIRLLHDLQRPDPRETSKTERDELADTLFGQNSGQQDLDDCLRGIVVHLVGRASVVRFNEQTTCSLCQTQSKVETSEAPFVFTASDKEEATLENLLDASFTSVDWNCGTEDCPGCTESVLPPDQRNQYATHTSCLADDTPDTLMIVFKRKGFDFVNQRHTRNTTHIDIRRDVMVRSLVGDKIVAALFTPLYVVFHSSSPSSSADHNQGRSAYNVPDQDCPQSWAGNSNKGHYFGGLVVGGGLTFYDDLQDSLSEGEFQDVNARGRKIVGVVLVKGMCAHCMSTQNDVALCSTPYCFELACHLCTDASGCFEAVERTWRICQTCLKEKEGNLDASNLVCSHGCEMGTTVEQCSTRSCTGLSCHLCTINTGLLDSEESSSWRICLACLGKRMRADNSDQTASEHSRKLRAMVKPYTKKDEGTRDICHRIANQVFLFLIGHDDAVAIESLVDWIGPADRRDRVRALFLENGDDARGIVMSALARMWKARITVHDMYGFFQVYEEPLSLSEASPISLVVALCDSVVYPTSSLISENGEGLVLRPAEGDAVEVMSTWLHSGGGAEFDTITHLIIPFVTMMLKSGKNTHCLPPSLKSTNGLADLVDTLVPAGKGSAYWYTRRSMQTAGINYDSSLLARATGDSKDTVIECSYAMMHAIIKICEVFFPFTANSKHVILGAGRRLGMMLHLLIDKDITVVAIERAQVHVEAVALQARMQAAIPGHRPKMLLVQKDASLLKSLDGFDSACRFVGSKSSSIDLDERNRIDIMVLSCPTMRVYWTCHLKDFSDLGLSESITKQWKILAMGGTRQENSRITTYFCFRLKPANLGSVVCKEVQSFLDEASGRPVYESPQTTAEQWGPRKSSRRKTATVVPLTLSGSGSSSSTKEKKKPTAVSPALTKPAKKPTAVSPALKKPPLTKPAKSASKPALTKPALTKPASTKPASKPASKPALKKSASTTPVSKLKKPAAGDGISSPTKNLGAEFEQTGLDELGDMVKKLISIEAARSKSAKSVGEQLTSLPALMGEKFSQTVSEIAAKLSEQGKETGNPKGQKNESDTTRAIQVLRDEMVSADRKENNGLLRGLMKSIAEKDRDVLWLELQRNKAAVEKEQAMAGLAVEAKKAKKKSKKEMQQRDKEAADLAVGAKKEKKKSKKAKKKRKLESSESKPKRSRSRSRGRRERSRSRSRGRRERSRSRSGERARSRSSSRKRDQGKRSPPRDRDRSRSRDRRGSRQPERRDRDRRARSRGKSGSPLRSRTDKKAVLECGVQGVSNWLLQKNFSTKIRKLFAEHNICGADLQYLGPEQLRTFGMEDHNVARYNLLTEELLK